MGYPFLKGHILCAEIELLKSSLRWDQPARQKNRSLLCSRRGLTSFALISATAPIKSMLNDIQQSAGSSGIPAGPLEL